MNVTKGNHQSGRFTLLVSLYDEKDFAAVSLTASKSGYTSLSMHFDTAEQRQEFIKHVTEAPVTTYD
jgi:hypothetical protein